VEKSNLEETTKASFTDCRLFDFFRGQTHALSWNPNYSWENIKKKGLGLAFILGIIAGGYLVSHRDKVFKYLGLEPTFGLQQEKTYSPIKNTINTINNPYKLKPKEFYKKN